MFRYGFSKSAILCLVALLLMCYIPNTARANSAKSSTAVPNIEKRCIADLSTRLNVPADEIVCVQATKVTWPNTALGLEQPGKMYAMMMTPGWKFILETHNVKYLYTASENFFRYGGPLDLWSGSALYVEPSQNDPNLNGDLIQISLMGTHPRTIMKGVTDFYPQSNGGVIATRRTSRSGFDLLYLAPGKINKPVVIAGGFAFGDAAINDKGSEWIAFHKNTLSFNWNIIRGKVGMSQKDCQTIDLPDGAKPDGATWTKKGFYVRYILNGVAKTYHLTEQNKLDSVYEFDSPIPTEGGFMLNKSETVGVENEEVNGKTNAVILRVWFTGDVQTKVVLPNFKYLHATPIGYGNLLLSGLRNDHYAAYVVNFNDGEHHSVIEGVNSIIKYWNVPPNGATF